MKTIGILSDTHGNYTAIDRAMSVLAECDYVFHLGDCFTDMRPYASALAGKLVCVKGNCDAARANAVEIVEVEGKRLMLTHGDRFGVKTTLQPLADYAAKEGADAVFYGHTHVAGIDERGGVTLVNPGALSFMTREKSIAYAVVASGKVVVKINGSLFWG